MDNRPIGVFDSGVGGLTVTKEIFSNLPNEEIIYFGDCKRSPFGELTKETLLIYSDEICDFLIKQDVKVIVVACNTICANCLEIIINKYPIPIIGLIIPAIDAAIEIAQKSIGLLATNSTINSRAHEKMLKSKNTYLEFYGVSCPKLVPIIENGESNSTLARDSVYEYLSDLLSKNIDTLVLGCTHYPLMLETIKNLVGNIKIVDPSSGTALSLKKTLTDKNMLRGEKLEPKHKFYISGNKDKFDLISNMVFGENYESKILELGN